MTDQLDNPRSRVDLVKHRGRETVTAIATVDDLIAYGTGNGGLIIEFVRHGADGKPLDSYRVTVCPEDADRIRKTK
jgi:hypothetical protein